MTSKNLGQALMAIGALDDLAMIIQIGVCVNPDTLPERIRECTKEILRCLKTENFMAIQEGLEPVNPALYYTVSRTKTA